MNVAISHRKNSTFDRDEEASKEHTRAACDK